MARPAASRTRGAPWTVKPRALASWWARSPPRPTTPLRRADGRTSAAVDCASAAYNDYDADYDSGAAQTTSQLATSLPFSLLPLPPPSPSPSLSPPTWPPTGPTIPTLTGPTLGQIAFGAPSSNAKGLHTAGHPRSHLRAGLHNAYYAYADYDAFDYDAFFATDFDRYAALTTARPATPLPTLTSPSLGQIAFDAP